MPWEAGSVGDVLRKLCKNKLVTARLSNEVREAIVSMKEAGVSQLPVVDDNERLLGIVTESDILTKLLDKNYSMESTIAEVMVRKVSTIAVNQDAAELLRIFEREEVGVVVDEDEKLIGILTKIDLVDHLTQTLT